MKIIVYRVGKNAETIDIPDGLAAQQAIVGGYIQALPIEEGLNFFVNDEGRVRGLQANRRIGAIDRDNQFRDVLILGNFFIGRHSRSGKSIDVTDADVRRFGANVSKKAKVK